MCNILSTMCCDGNVVYADARGEVIKRVPKWFRYVEDTLALMPKGTNMKNKLHTLNNVIENIQVTVVKEAETKLQ